MEREVHQNEDRVDQYLNDIDNGEYIDDNLHYFILKVLDSQTENPVPNAQVMYDVEGKLWALTNNKGIATWETINQEITCHNLVISHPGYYDYALSKRTGRAYPYPDTYNPSDPIYLIKMDNVGYSYKIIVKDSNTKKPVALAQVEMRSVDDTFIDNNSHNKTDVNGEFNFYSELYDKFKFRITKVGYQDSFFVTVNGTEDSNTPLGTVIILEPTLAGHYYYVMCAKDNAGNPVSGVTFNIYKDFGYTERFDEIDYTTDANGLVYFDYGDSPKQPLTAIYAMAVSKPLGYEFGSIYKGKVTPTLIPTNPGLTITLTSYTASYVYYYNIRVIDNVTEQPLKDVQITFSYQGSELSKKTTDKNGVVYFSTNYDSVTISASKDGYATGYENCITLPGNASGNSYRQINAEPSNSIKVEYEDGQPAVNIYVKIFTYDESKNYLLIGKFRTHSNGYIDTLSPSYYTMGGMKATIPTHSSRVWNISSGNMLLRIPRTEVENNDDEKAIKQFTKMSANGIKTAVNSDNVYYDSGNDFKMKILDPDSITTLDIFTSTPVMMYNNSKKNIIGSVDIALKPDVNDLRMKVVNRYSGFYNPIFKDILFYDNFWSDKRELPYTNSTFDYEYSDNQGKFGFINNLWFHKVNDNKKINIVNTLMPFYPITGQYALDYRDYNIFSSSWDMNYYTRQIDKEHSELCNNISSMKNGLCMFGSKYLNVPNVIEINGLTIGDDSEWKGEWNDDWITNPEGCPGEIMYKEVNDNSVDFYFFLTKRILRYMTDKLYDEFKKYVSDENSFGKPGIEDDIEEYVKKNVLKLYKLDKVRMFVRRTKKGMHNSRIENDYISNLEYYKDGKTGDKTPVTVDYFKKHGFVEVNTVSLSKLNRDDFDRKLVYNLRNGAKEEFGFSFVLKKI